MNRRPPAPKAGALPGCATPRALKVRAVGGAPACRQPAVAAPRGAPAARVRRRHGRRPTAACPPLRPAVVGPLADVVAPPYDVIDEGQRAALMARSPFNVVAIDLPHGRARTPMRARASCSRAGSCRERWCATASRRSGPTRRTTPAPTACARTRRGFFCRVRIEDYGPGRVRPHERTHPGPKEDRLRLTRATRANISPIFSLYSDPSRPPGRRSRRPPSEAPWGEVERRRRHRPPPLAGRRPGRDRGRAGARPASRAADRRRAPPLRDHAGLRAGGRRRGRAPLHPHVPGRARGPRADGVPHPPPCRGTDRRAPARARAGARARLRRQRGLPRGSWRRRPARGRSSSATSTGATSGRCACA